MILSGTTLYGEAVYGGSSGDGTVFAVNINGTSFTTLYNFTNGSDGGNPVGGLILSGNTLYGTAGKGGLDGIMGTVFAVNTDGTGFTILHTFTNGTDGYNPFAGLILSGNTLYGTTVGGSSGYGTVFALNIGSGVLTPLHSFTNGSDGACPEAGLILSGNTLFGTAMNGGSSGGGTVFAVNTDGTGFRTLHSLNGYSDGAMPCAGLISSGNTLYGTASEGGSNGGTVFAVNTDGTGFTVLYSFTNGSDGGEPQGALLLSGNTLYGTARDDQGTVFSISLPPPPQLSIFLSGTNVILTWTNTASGTTLQSTTDLSPAVWSTNLPAPVVINGQNTVTNPISGTQQFYQLSRLQ